MRYNFSTSELLAMEEVWDYSDDDQGNDIFNILVDTLVKDKIEIYIVYSNCTIRKFSAPITTTLIFEEHTHIYNLEYLFKGKGKEN